MLISPDHVPPSERHLRQARNSVVLHVSVFYSNVRYGELFECVLHMLKLKQNGFFFLLSYIYSYMRYLAIWGFEVLTIIMCAKFVIQNQFSANHIARKILSTVTKMRNLYKKKKTLKGEKVSISINLNPVRMF